MYYITNGGFLMYFILLMSIVGLTAIIERGLYFLKNESKNLEALPKELITALENGKLKDVIIELNKEKSSTSKVLKEMLLELYKAGGSANLMKIEEKGKEKALFQITQLERNMWLISLAAHLTPLLGLLGTVTGMIQAFQAVALHGTGDAGVLAKGISEALFTTAGGLFVAIPALVFYNYYNKKIDRIVSNIEITSTELINYFRR